MILLTGATGTAGSFIANEFVRERVPVRILVRNRAKAAGLEKVPTVEIVEGDMSRPSSLGSALDGVERVLMISAPLMDKPSSIPLGRIAEVEEIADLVVMLASPLMHMVNGTMIEIDGGQDKPLMDRFRDKNR